MNDLAAMAILPGLYLIWYVYQQDKIEKEPTELLVRLAFFGALGVFLAMIVENVLINYIISPILGKGTVFLLVENFIGVALVEEWVKFRALKNRTWNHPAFDYRFDAVVYAVAAGMGFAILENVFYVFENGMDVAIMRAFTSLPGHCIFAIYMGCYYGEAKLCEKRGNIAGMNANLRNALWVPTLIHGAYDFCLTENGSYLLLFFALVIYYDIKAYKKLKLSSKTDTKL